MPNAIIPTPCAFCGAEPVAPDGWTKIVAIAAIYDAAAPLVPFVAIGDHMDFYFDKDDCRTAWLARARA